MIRQKTRGRQKARGKVGGGRAKDAEILIWGDKDGQELVH